MGQARFLVALYIFLERHDTPLTELLSRIDLLELSGSDFLGGIENRFGVG